MTRLRDIIDEAAEIEGCTLDEITVLKIVTDPYRCDSPAVRRDAQWIADRIAKFSNGKQIHLRGLHYLIVAAGDVLMPNGKRYVNTDECYIALNEWAAAARWLGLVPFEQIIDQRNDPPFIPEESPVEEPRAGLVAGDAINVPDVEDLMPRFTVNGFGARQPYRLVMFGEKSSLYVDLKPLAIEYGAELIVAAGENSLTLIHDMLRRAQRDGRPVRCFYYSDFDPSGYHMPISTARKIQGMRDQFFPDLDLRLYKVALNAYDVVRLKLPQTPIKDGEKRGPAWRKRWAMDAVEIDALIALHPGELEHMARNALDGFFDANHETDVEQAREDWLDEAQEAIEDHPEYSDLVETVTDARAAVEAAVEQLTAAQLQATVTLLAVKPPEIEVPEADADGDVPSEKRCPKIFDTEDDFADASRQLRELKTYRS